MLETFKNFGGKKLGGLILIIVIIIAFGFGGFGGGFSTNNQNNIAKINKTNVTTQDFMDYVNQSGISQDAIRNNLDKGIIEELLSGLISTTLIDLEVKDFNILVSEKIIFKLIKDNKNYHDENGIFQRVKYEKFLLSNNLSAPMFELKLKNRELQKHLFDIIGAGTITPNFLIDKKYEENNKTLIIEYFNMEGLYREKNEYTDQDLVVFIKENEDQLKREYIDFKYVVLNPKNLIGIEEFNQEFFDEVDKIENQISEGADFETILENINVEVKEIIEYAPTSEAQTSESLIYQNKSSKLNLIENGDNFLLYNINKEYDKSPNLNDDKTKGELVELIYQKGKFDFNRKILEEIQSKEFNDSKFEDLAINNFPTGQLSYYHAVHIHTGTCESPLSPWNLGKDLDYSFCNVLSMGEVWAKPKAGDLGNVFINEAGMGNLNLQTDLFNVGSKDATDIIGKIIYINEVAENFTQECYEGHNHNHNNKKIACGTIKLVN